MSCSWLFYLYSSSVSPADSYYSPHAGEAFSKTDLGMDSESSLNGLEDVLINHQNRGDTESTASGAGGGSLHHHLNSSHAPPGDASSSSSSSTHHHHHPHVTPSSIFGSSMTPIDKLYSMQNSYFSSSDCECLGAASNWEVIQGKEKEPKLKSQKVIRPQVQPSTPLLLFSSSPLFPSSSTSPFES